MGEVEVNMWKDAGRMSGEIVIRRWRAETERSIEEK